MLMNVVLQDSSISAEQEGSVGLIASIAASIKAFAFSSERAARYIVRSVLDISTQTQLTCHRVGGLAQMAHQICDERVNDMQLQHLIVALHICLHSVRDEVPINTLPLSQLVHALMQLLARTESQFAFSAAGSLQILAGHASVREYMQAENGIALLLRAISSTNIRLVVKACSCLAVWYVELDDYVKRCICLMNIRATEDECRKAVNSSSGIDMIVRLLSSSHSDVTAAAVGIITRFDMCSYYSYTTSFVRQRRMCISCHLSECLTNIM